MYGYSMVGINGPEKLVPGKFFIVAVGRHIAAILWKDEKFFLVTNEKPNNVIEITETYAYVIVAKGQYVRPVPIPLENVSEWVDQAEKVDIALDWTSKEIATAADAQAADTESF